MRTPTIIVVKKYRLLVLILTLCFSCFANSNQLNDSVRIYQNAYSKAKSLYSDGYYKEALPLFREYLNHYPHNVYSEHYIRVMHSYALCCFKSGNTALSSLVSAQGAASYLLADNESYLHLFEQIDGLLAYEKEDYSTAVKKLKRALKGFEKDHDKENIAYTYLYLGKSHLELKQQDESIYYFRKVATIYDNPEYQRPELRQAYEMLIDFSLQRHNTQEVIAYTKKVLAADRNMAKRYPYLFKKTPKKYQTGQLLQLGEEAEAPLRSKLFLTLTAFAMPLFLFLYYKKRGKRCDNSTITNTSASERATPEINPELEKGILEKLERFENEHGYLEKEITQARLAFLLSTNIRYVAVVLSRHRHKNSIDYISDLKIDYIIRLLKTDSKYRLYSNEALGNEAGFGSTQSFMKAFKARVGVSVGTFTKELPDNTDK